MAVLKQNSLKLMRGRLLRILLERGEGSNELGAVTHRLVVRVPICKDIRQAMGSVKKAYEKEVDLDSPETSEFLLFIKGICERGFDAERRRDGVCDETDLLSTQNMSFLKRSQEEDGSSFRKSGALYAQSEGGRVESGVSVYYLGDSIGSVRFRCLIINTPQSVRCGYKCFFVESLVKRGGAEWRCPPGSIYGKRYLDGFGMVPCTMLYVEKDCTYSDRRQSTIRDHRELMRSLGCAVLVDKKDHCMSRNMDVLSWNTSFMMGGEKVEFLSIFTPMFW